MELEHTYNQVNACSVVRMGHLARDCLNRGMRDDSGINLKPAIRQLCGNGRRCIFVGFHEAGYHDDSTTRSRARLGIHYVSRARCNLSVLLWSFWNDYYSTGYLGPVRSKIGHSCFIGTQTEQESAPPPSPTTAANTTHSADHRERYAIEQDLSFLTSLQHLESLNESSIIPTVQSMSITFGWRLC